MDALAAVSLGFTERQQPLAVGASSQRGPESQAEWWRPPPQGSPGRRPPAARSVPAASQVTLSLPRCSRATEISLQEGCSRREGQESFIHRSYLWVPGGERAQVRATVESQGGCSPAG